MRERQDVTVETRSKPIPDHPEGLPRLQPGIKIPQGRKTIQVTACLDSVGKYFVLAVCDDGTMWQLSNLYRECGKEPFWEVFPSPPVK